LLPVLGGFFSDSGMMPLTTDPSSYYPLVLSMRPGWK
jgi:hypothetical protein